MNVILLMPEIMFKDFVRTSTIPEKLLKKYALTVSI